MGSRAIWVQAYPEYARYVLENADASFNAALSEWERRFQQVTMVMNFRVKNSDLYFRLSNL